LKTRKRFLFIYIGHLKLVEFKWFEFKFLIVSNN